MPQTFLDIFNNDAFSEDTLTAKVNQWDFAPGRVGALGIFDEVPIMTTTAVIEEIAGTLELIQTSPRGSSPEQEKMDKRKVRSLVVPHLSRARTLLADQFQNVRAFGMAEQLQTVEMVTDRLLKKMTRNMEATLENHRLGAIKGIVKDADGSELYDLFDFFGVSQIAEQNFALETAETKVKLKCAAIRRLMAKELGSLSQNKFKIRALCSDEFYDALTTHSEVKEAYARWNSGQALREDYTYEEFVYAGITFENYRGSDDGSISIEANKANFFPEIPGAGLFETVYAPADRFSELNQLGMPKYIFPSHDLLEDKWHKFEIQSNPLCYCTRPRVLIQAKKS